MRTPYSTSLPRYHLSWCYPDCDWQAIKLREVTAENRLYRLTMRYLPWNNPNQARNQNCTSQSQKKKYLTGNPKNGKLIFRLLYTLIHYFINIYKPQILKLKILRERRKIARQEGTGKRRTTCGRVADTRGVNERLLRDNWSSTHVGTRAYTKHPRTVLPPSTWAQKCQRPPRCSAPTTIGSDPGRAPKNVTGRIRAESPKRISAPPPFRGGSNLFSTQRDHSPTAAELHGRTTANQQHTHTSVKGTTRQRFITITQEKAKGANPNLI